MEKACVREAWARLKHTYGLVVACASNGDILVVVRVG